MSRTERHSRRKGSQCFCWVRRAETVVGRSDSGRATDWLALISLMRATPSHLPVLGNFQRHPSFEILSRDFLHNLKECGVKKNAASAGNLNYHCVRSFASLPLGPCPGISGSQWRHVSRSRGRVLRTVRESLVLIRRPGSSGNSSGIDIAHLIMEDFPGMWFSCCPA